MTTALSIAVVAVTRRGLDQARLLRQRLRSGEVHRPARYGATDHHWENAYAGELSQVVADLFSRCRQIVFFLAAGAVTRLIAPCLRSKETDPGVLAVDEAGNFVIPLLSGHLGGANDFARTVAGCLGAIPVITTASDVVGGLSLDVLAETHGWTPEPRDRLKHAARALVDGEPFAIFQEVGTAGSWLNEVELPANVTFARAPSQVSPDCFVLSITDRAADTLDGIAAERVLRFRPKSLVLGVGCERGITATALEDGLDQFLAKSGFAKSSIATVASVDLKADEQGITELAQRHGWHTLYYSAEELAAVSGIPNPSDVVNRCVGTPGVAEPAALLASGAANLLVPKQIIQSPLAPQRMTFALARMVAYELVASDVPPLTPPRSGGDQTAFPSRPGVSLFLPPRSRGGPGWGVSEVLFVGAGPGDPDLLTIKGRRALAQADVVIYAGSLVPEALLHHAAPTAVLCNSAHLTLEQVMQQLTSAVRVGKRVVRLHSGDTSLYSAIQEQMAILDEAGIAYQVIPGVSSFQAAAAALCAELTLPEVVQTVILTRAEGQTPMPAGEALADLARHQATLCIFLSARLADDVQAQLLTAYPPDTPVAIVHRISWPDEQIILTDLSQLATDVRRHHLTRTTLILVGPALGRRQNRSRLYDKNHAHIFRAKSRDQTHPSP